VQRRRTCARTPQAQSCARAGAVGPADNGDARQEALDKKERELIEAMATIRTLRADQAMPCHAMPCHAMPRHATPCHATANYPVSDLRALTLE
jgi:hypothetical protein